MRKHRPGLECPECKQMIAYEQVRYHKQTHLPESERRFKCSQCGRGFISSHHLENHYKSVHSDERPHICQYMCGYCCKRAGNLRKHENICKIK